MLCFSTVFDLLTFLFPFRALALDDVSAAWFCYPSSVAWIFCSDSVILMLLFKALFVLEARFVGDTD